VKKSLLTLSLIASLLAACNPVSERECGRFDHPDYALWQAESRTGQVQFLNSEGASIDMVRQAVVVNMPFLGTDGASNDEDVQCNLTATVRWQASDNSLAITSIYTQEEKLLLPSEDEELLIDHQVEVPAGNVLLGGYRADISNDGSRNNFPSEQVTYLEDGVETEEIGGQAYEDVIRIDALALSVVDDIEQGLAIDHVQQIVIAREFGLIAFTDADGQEFVRVPTP